MTKKALLNLYVNSTYLQEEWSIEVKGMSLPPRGEIETKLLETYDAIQLFLQRAGRTRPDFTLSLENSPDVVTICQLVDGMPLGLELAATWLLFVHRISAAARTEQRHHILQNGVHFAKTAFTRCSRRKRAR